MFLKDLSGGLHIRRLSGYDQILFRHHLIDRAVHILFETQVTVRHDTNQIPAFIHHGNTANLIFSHHCQGIRHTFALRDSHRIIDHSILRTFNGLDLLCLLGDRHVFMNHTNTSLTGDSDSQLGLSNRIHSGRHHRYIQCDIT